LNYYLKNPLEIIMLNHGGLVFLGGFVPAIIVAVLYVKSKKLDVALLANICAPYVPLGHAIGRIGCFFNGCCYGKAADLPWCIFMDGANRHPSQIYSSLFNFGIFGILLAIRNKKWASGVRLIFIYMFLYGTGRFIVEFFRGDKVDVFGVFRISQWISIGMILFSVIAYYISCRTFLLTTNNTNCTNKKK
ncbi:prolipoprotein diacylglyceryl transferase, partial [bacterium]|nr:prolipoprotein diacylglyceryl transferase [bacterium]